MKENFYIQFGKEDLDKALHCAEIIKNRNYSSYSSLKIDIEYQHNEYKDPIAIWTSLSEDVFVNVANESNKKYWKENDIKEITYEEFLDL